MGNDILETINSKLDILLERTSRFVSDKIVTGISVKTDANLSFGLDKLAAKLNTPPEEIRKVIEVYDNDVAILKPIQGNSDYTKMLKVCIIIAAVKYFVFGTDTVDTRYLTAKIESLGINHNRNLGKVFKTGTEYFIPKNKSKERVSEYKITLPCQMKGLELINELMIEKE